MLLRPTIVTVISAWCRALYRSLLMRNGLGISCHFTTKIWRRSGRSAHIGPDYYEPITRLPQVMQSAYDAGYLNDGRFIPGRGVTRAASYVSPPLT